MGIETMSTGNQFEIRNRKSTIKMGVIEMMTVIKRVSMGIMLALLLALAASVQADEVAPVVDGLGDGGQTNGTASIAFPTIYLSAPGNGNVAGYGYADEDIMQFNTGTSAWSKAFDGTNAGLPASADINALAVQNTSGYVSFFMSFVAPTAVPGLGTVTASDVVRYDTWNGQWSMYLDGSQYGLTTNGEKIDALALRPGTGMIISTTGNFNVPAINGGKMKGKDEDLIIKVTGTDTYSFTLAGTAIGLQGNNDIIGTGFAKVTNDQFVDTVRYISAQKAWKLRNSVNVGAFDIAQEQFLKNGTVFSGILFDASAQGFPKIDAFDVVP